jgi:hypothetical protein
MWGDSMRLPPVYPRGIPRILVRVIVPRQVKHGGEMKPGEGRPPPVCQSYSRIPSIPR